MTEEEIMLAQMLARELMEMNEEEMIKFEHVLDTEMMMYDQGN